MEHLDFAFSEKLNAASWGTIVLRWSVHLRTLAEAPQGWGRVSVFRGPSRERTWGGKVFIYYFYFCCKMVSERSTGCRSDYVLIPILQD